MKCVYFFVLLALMFNYQQLNGQVVAVGDVHGYLNKIATVYGIVAEANFDRTKKNDTTIIVLSDSADRGKIKLTIAPLVRAKFGYRPELVLINKKIYVSGMVTRLNEYYQINITSPFDISFSSKQPDVAPETDKMTEEVAAVIIETKPAAAPKATKPTSGEIEMLSSNVEKPLVATPVVQTTTKVKQPKKKANAKNEPPPANNRPLDNTPTLATPEIIIQSKSKNTLQPKRFPANIIQPSVIVPPAPVAVKAQQPKNNDNLEPTSIIAKTDAVSEPQAAKPTTRAKKRIVKTEPQKAPVNETFAVVEITAIVDSSGMKRSRNVIGKKLAGSSLTAPTAIDKQAGNKRYTKTNKSVQQAGLPPNSGALVENNSDTLMIGTSLLYVLDRPLNPMVSQEFMTQKILKLYSGPGNFFIKNGTIKKGLRVKVVSVSFDWVKIIIAEPVKGKSIEGYTLLKNLIGN